MGTVLMTILLSALFILFVLALLAALVYSWSRLTKSNVTAGEDREQRILKTSVLHVVLRGGR